MQIQQKVGVAFELEKEKQTNTQKAVENHAFRPGVGHVAAKKKLHRLGNVTRCAMPTYEASTQ